MCKVLGHSPTFWADGNTMRWECERGCGEGDGSKNYASAADAERYAKALNKRDNEDIGKRAPLLGLLPLRIWRWFKNRNQQG
ncbi:hypothetical protein [Corynebacterium halotolerans]|uniref:hypothetical protein n=1 Tax=Corynebacterium halotolerans TaxID=225326 RepID=UPI003CF2B2BE